MENNVNLNFNKTLEPKKEQLQFVSKERESYGR